MIDINAAVAAEVAVGPDMTKASAGGGEREVSAAGATRLRFVGYVEIGKHTKQSGKGAGKTQDLVQLTFELSGKNHPPREFDGKKYPQLIVIKENKSLNPKANFFKLFNTMNWEGKATHMAQLLGQDYIGTIEHYTFDGRDGDKVTLAQLRGDNGYTIRSPFRVDEDDQKVRVKVDPALTALRVFFWNTASKEQWDSLFIDGEYEAREGKDGKPGQPAKSKNVIQNLIKLADNFKGSKVEELLVTNGVALDVPDADVPVDERTLDMGDDETPEPPAPKAKVTKPKAQPVGKAADDVLNGIVG